MKLLPLVCLAFPLVTGCSTDQHPAAGGRAAASDPAGGDPYLWLEEVTGERALAWVGEQNKTSTNRLAVAPGFAALQQRFLGILDSKEKIPYPQKRGAYYYNFWRDDQHPKGVWRRTSPAEFRKAAPAWETVLDLDQLSASEKEKWVWKGSATLHPRHDRALLFLSRGGADAVVVREFDLERKVFVTDGFVLPEAKTDIGWRDRDTIYVGTDFGPDSLTSSGYPRIVKEWKRGTPLSTATTVFAGQAADVSVSAGVDHDHGHTYEWIIRAMTFFSNESHLRQGDRWVRIEKPDDAEVSTFDDQLLIRLRTAWTVGGKTHPGGALLATPLAAFLAGGREFTTLFEPGPRRSLQSFDRTQHYLLVNELDNVRNRLYAWTRVDGRWTRAALPGGGFGSLGISGVDEEESDEFFLTATDFLTPTSLHLGTVGRPELELLKRTPGYFDASGLEITQHEAVSKDGTRIPYFQVSHRDRKGPGPTLLTAYGGFEVSLVPYYNAEAGAAWLERGCTYVVANLRGGGEFGPAWHQAAIKEHRQRAYEDFAAVSEDLIKRKVTTPRQLGIMGGSNGGLLMGAAFTQRPELYRAVVCQVPLLDMRRYHKLLAGASWMGEYGDPDRPEEWAFIGKYSPYQNVRAGVHYPHILFTTSTRDDRVHPGHARKMMARMTEQGHAVLYYENTEGGHAGAADNRQRAFMSALAYTYLQQELE